MLTKRLARKSLMKILDGRNTMTTFFLTMKKINKRNHLKSWKWPTNGRKVQSENVIVFI